MGRKTARRPPEDGENGSDFRMVTLDDNDQRIPAWHTKTSRVPGS